MVDDNAVILTDASAILQEAGFEVLTAMHADEALRLLAGQGHRLTVLFTDVEMPGSMDGFELARHADRHWPAIAIIVASGRRSPKPGELPEGATFIGKPFSAEVVQATSTRSSRSTASPNPLRHLD